MPSPQLPPTFVPTTPPLTDSNEATSHVTAILGGAGPGATAQLYARVIEFAQNAGSHQDWEYPHLVISSYPFTSLTQQGLAAPDEDSLTELIAATEPLVRYGCDSLAIACNSLHRYLPALAQHLAPYPNISLIDMVAETVAATCSLNASSVGLVTSTSSIATGLYHRPLTHAGLDVLVPHNQELVDSVIEAAMSGRTLEVTRAAVTSIVEDLVANGAQAVILGCTELSLVAPYTCMVPVVNSVDVLAHAILSYHLSKESSYASV